MAWFPLNIRHLRYCSHISLELSSFELIYLSLRVFHWWRNLCFHSNIALRSSNSCCFLNIWKLTKMKKKVLRIEDSRSFSLVTNVTVAVNTNVIHTKWGSVPWFSTFGPFPILSFLFFAVWSFMTFAHHSVWKSHKRGRITIFRAKRAIVLNKYKYWKYNSNETFCRDLQTLALGDELSSF